MDESRLSKDQMKEIALHAKNTLDSVKSAIALSPSDGSYYIPGITWVEFNDPRVRLLSWLLYQLTKSFPEYMFKQTESLNPTVKGMKITWYKKQ